MAKKSAEKPSESETDPSTPTAMSIKMTVGFRDWLNELAEFDRSAAVQVMEKGAILYAKQVGFTRPAPRRTEGR